MANYFNKDTQNAIERFNKTEKTEKKHQLYDEEIRRAFEKLVDNLIVIHRFATGTSHETLKNDCVSFLYESLHKFNPAVGSKAFSYFDVIAKNFLLAQQNKYNKHIQRDIKYVDRTNTNEPPYHYNMEQESVPSHEDQLTARNLFSSIFGEIDKWMERYKKPREQLVLNGILCLMEHHQDLDIINKKSIYLYLREITGLNTKQVVAQLNKFRRSYGFYKKRNARGEEQ